MGPGWAPNALYSVSLWKGEIWTQRCSQGEWHVKRKAEMGVILLQADKTKDGQQTTGADPPSQPTKGADPADTSISDFEPPELGDNAFC